MVKRKVTAEALRKKNYSLQGKKNRQAGQRFELKVRKDLESRGWIVDRWGNNVSFSHFQMDFHSFNYPPEEDEDAKLIPAKSRFNLRTTGFPDFIAFCRQAKIHTVESINYQVIGVECKSRGYLDKEEKEKCSWLLENNIFSKILIASKGKKRGEIVYKEFEDV